LLPTLIIILFCLSVRPVSAQNKADSLIQVLQSCPEAQKMDLLNQISDAYSNSEPDKCVEYARKALQEAKLKNNDDALIMAYQNMGYGHRGLYKFDTAMIYVDSALNFIVRKELSPVGTVLFLKGSIFESMGLYDSTLHYLNIAQEMFLQENDSLNIAHVFNELGMVASDQGKYAEAIENYLKALEIHEKMGSLGQQSVICNNLAIVYAYWDNLDKSLEYFLKSLDLETKRRNLIMRTTILSNIGEVYVMMGDNLKGIEYYQKAIESGQNVDDRLGLAYANNNIACVYTEISEYDSADLHLTRALQYGLEINKPHLLVNIYNSYSNLYRKRGDFTEAIKYLDKSHSLAVEHGHASEFLDNYFNYHELYLERGNHKKALEYYKKYAELSDSLFTEEKHQQVADLQTKYETEKHKERNELLAKENEIQTLRLKKNRTALLALTVIGIMAIIVLFVLFSSYQRRQKNKQELLRQEANFRMAQLENIISVFITKIV